MPKTIIAGVSEWIFEFENGDMTKLNTLIKEDVVAYSNGEIEICLTDATFDEQFHNNFAEGSKIKGITRRMNKYPVQSVNMSQSQSKKVEVVYSDLVITKISSTRASNDCATFDIYIKNKSE